MAARVAAPGASSPAIGAVLGGRMLAQVVGVPIGAFAGQPAGWQGLRHSRRAEAADPDVVQVRPVRM